MMKGPLTSWLLSRLLFRTSGGKLLTQFASRRLWPSLWLFLHQKGPDFWSSQDWFLYRDDATLPPWSMPPPQSRTWKGGEGVKTICYLLPATALFARFCPSGEWSRSWLASPCPRRASRQAVMGSSVPSPKTSLPLPFCGWWISVKRPSESAGTRPKCLGIMEFIIP